MQWILASASPRRKQLLGELIEKFDIIPARGEERLHGEKTPEQVVMALASQKAREVANLPTAKGKAVIGSDTVVAIDGEILGKPQDERDASDMLSRLSGRAHEVYTGVCIVYDAGTPKEKTICQADCTKVFFNELSSSQIREYIATGSPMDKAGAYGIQDGGLVEKIEGSFSNVVGLPIELLKKMLQENGI